MTSAEIRNWFSSEGHSKESLEGCSDRTATDFEAFSLLDRKIEREKLKHKNLIVSATTAQLVLSLHVEDLAAARGMTKEMLARLSRCGISCCQKTGTLLYTL